MRHIRKVFLLLGLTIAISGPLLAQVDTGTIEGIVTDPSGAAVPKVKVTALNQDTNFSRSGVTTDDGSYLIPQLPIGPHYQITAEVTGFKTFVRTGVALQLKQNARMDMQLEVGTGTQNVEVKAQTPLVDTESTTGGEVVGTDRLRELPLNGRNPIQLAGLITGVSALNAVDTLSNGNRNASSLSVNGSRANDVDWELNGIRFAGSYLNLGLNYPNPDALSEFKLVTNPNSAEIGEYSGALFTAVMKSGTNQFHGDLFEFLRSTHLNARPFFASGITPYHQNQFGGTFGGPVVKNRLFFFGTYQGLRIRQQILNVSYPLSTDERNGLVTSSTPVINPATNAPFPQNAASQYILPRVNPVAANILKYVPTLAVAGTPYFQAGSSAVNVNQAAFKIDYIRMPSDQVYGSFLLDDTSPHNPFYQGDYPDYGTVHQVQNTHVIAISEVHSFRPSLINEFRFGESYQNELYTNVNPVSPASLGMTGWNYDYLPDAQPEGATFSLLGRFGLGSLGLGKWREGGRNLQFTDILSWVKGRHNMRMGTDLYHREHHLDANACTTGCYYFNGYWTGNPTADFLLGDLSLELKVRYLSHPGYRAWTDAYFFQDDWKVSRRLTLNMGLRYQLMYPFAEYRAQGDDSFQSRPAALPISGNASYVYGAHSTALPYAPEGLLYEGDKTSEFPNGLPKSMIALDKLQFQPRLGLAWDPFGNGKTGVRASGGLFSSPQQVDLPAQVGQNLPFIVFQTQIKPVDKLDNPYASQTPYPVVTSGNLATNPAYFSPSYLPVAGYGWAPNWRMPRVGLITANVQQQIGSNLMVEVGYVGKLSRHLPQTRNINAAPLSPTNTYANVQSRRVLDPVNYNKIDYEESSGNASYNSLQITARYRGGHGLNLLYSFTWAHSIDTWSTYAVQSVVYQDNNNINGSRGNSDFDQRLVSNLSLVYDIPSPVSRATSRTANHILGNWELTGIVSAQSGTPFTVSTGYDASITAAGGDRPDLIGDPFFPGGRPRGQEIAAYINPAAFVANSVGTYGNVGRNSFYNPGAFNSDLGLFKNFPFEDGRTLQFRAEFFNAFNQVHLGSPNGCLACPGFGSITSARSPRLVQFGLKFLF